MSVVHCLLGKFTTLDWPQAVPALNNNHITAVTVNYIGAFNGAGNNPAAAARLAGPNKIVTQIEKPANKVVWPVPGGGGPATAQAFCAATANGRNCRKAVFSYRLRIFDRTI